MERWAGMITRASSRSVPIVLLVAVLVLCTLEKTLSGSQEVMGRLTNNNRKFLMLGKLSVSLRADMAVWGLSSISAHLCLHLFISRSNSIGEVVGHSDWYFVSRTLATSSLVTEAAGTNPWIRCFSKMTCCWFGPNYRLRSSITIWRADLHTLP